MTDYNSQPEQKHVKAIWSKSMERRGQQKGPWKIWRTKKDFMIGKINIEAAFDL